MMCPLPLEVLRIADGRIAERWASGGDAVLLKPLGQLPVMDAETHTVVKVELHTVEPGASDELLGGGGVGPRLLYVEYGTVSVAGGQSAGAGPTSLVTKNEFAIAVNVGTTMTNARPETAMILGAMSRGRALRQDMEVNAPPTPANARVVVVLVTFLPCLRRGNRRSSA